MPPKKGKTPSLHAKCDPIPTGTVITDIKKNEIIVQKEFAQGGFGRIYDAKVKGSTTKYIVKFEPTDNGPLFNEIHLYPRILTQTALQNYTKEHKLRFLGLPHCVSSGVYKDVRYLVMPKYNYTLEQLISEKKGILSLENTVSVVLSVLDSLEYIHSCDYVHGDIKAGNLMLMSKLDFSKVYLIDFGLAKKINKPVEKDDPKKAHNGTALFTSIDAHRGCGPSFRGDIEILAHNALLWLTGKLPWKKVENTPDNVQKAKSDLMSNISQKVKQLVFDSTAAAFLISLYEASKELKIEQKPNYAAIKKEIAVGAVKRKHGDDESADIPRLRARKEVKAEKIEEKRKPSQRSFLKSESGTAQEPEKLEECKPKRPYLRKAGSAIAAAKKSNIIYPGLSKQLSLEKNDDIKKLSIETKPPVIKSPTNPSSCRPVLSKTSSAGFSEDSHIDAVSTFSNVELMARGTEAAPATRERLGRRAKDNAPSVLNNSILVGKKTANKNRIRNQGADSNISKKETTKREPVKKSDNVEDESEDETKPSSSKSVSKKRNKKPPVVESSVLPINKVETALKSKRVIILKKKAKDLSNNGSEDDASEHEQVSKPASKVKTVVTIKKPAKNLSEDDTDAPVSEPEQEVLKVNKTTKKALRQETAKPEPEKSEEPVSNTTTKRGSRTKVSNVEKKTEVRKPAPSKDRKQAKKNAVFKPSEPVVSNDETPDFPLRGELEEAIDLNEASSEEEIDEESALSKDAKTTKKTIGSTLESSSKLGIIPEVTKNMKSTKAKEAFAAKQSGDAENPTTSGRSKKGAVKTIDNNEKAELAAEPTEEAVPLKITRAKRLALKSVVTDEIEKPAPFSRSKRGFPKANNVDEDNTGVTSEKPKLSPLPPKKKNIATKKAFAALKTNFVDSEEDEIAADDKSDQTDIDNGERQKPIGKLPAVTKNMKSVEAKAAKEAVSLKTTRVMRGTLKSTVIEDEVKKPTSSGRPKRGALKVKDINDDDDKKSDEAALPETDINDTELLNSTRIIPGVTKNMKSAKAKEAFAAKEAADAEKSVASSRIKRGVPKTEHSEKFQPLIKKKATLRNPLDPKLEEEDEPTQPVSEVVASRLKKGRKIKDKYTLSAPSSPANPIIPGLSKNLKSEKAKAAIAIRDAAYAAVSSSTIVVEAPQPNIEEPVDVDDEPVMSSSSRKRANNGSTSSKSAKVRRHGPVESGNNEVNFSSSDPVHNRQRMTNASFGSDKGVPSDNGLDL